MSRGQALEVVTKAALAYANGCEVKRVQEIRQAVDVVNGEVCAAATEQEGGD